MHLCFHQYIIIMQYWPSVEGVQSSLMPAHTLCWQCVSHFPSSSSPSHPFLSLPLNPARGSAGSATDISVCEKHKRTEVIPVSFWYFLLLCCALINKLSQSMMCYLCVLSTVVYTRFSPTCYSVSQAIQETPVKAKDTVYCQQVPF